MTKTRDTNRALLRKQAEWRQDQADATAEQRQRAAKRTERQNRSGGSR